jgi:tetratricopeptide (TPR) repeat protein
MKALLLSCLGGLLLAGCATTQSPQTWQRTGDPIADGKAAIEHGPKRDKVLWQYRTAVAALRRGDFALAKGVLDDALLTLGGIYGPDKDAKRARGYFSAEAKKTFIGEPYERVMAYYYRGLLYWMDGETDNARACFRSAQFMDSDAENKEYSSDYVLLEYLDGFATEKLKGDGADALKRARSLAKVVKPPDYDPQANVLFFVEFGNGPTKYATGEYHEQLRFRSGTSSVRAVRIRANGQAVRAEAYDDLNYQATTRGGRVMDHVLANKAVFKSATDTAGNVAIISGAILAGQQGRNSAADEVGAGLLAAGVLSKIFSAATTPAADTRAWDNLPQYLGFASLTLPPGPHTVTVEYLDAAGNPISNLTRTVTIETLAAPRDTVIFVSDKKQ